MKTAENHDGAAEEGKQPSLVSKLHAPDQVVDNLCIHQLHQRIPAAAWRFCLRLRRKIKQRMKEYDEQPLLQS
jgi:hypothetical protein